MKNFIEVDQGYIGFGEEKSLAERDLLINKCRQNIEADVTGEFLKRRQELYPWQPRENMLHISGLGCLVYENGYLTNTGNGESIAITSYDKSIYYYLANLFRNSLSYTDITVVLRPELDKFFKSISEEFVSIAEMPYIKLLNTSNGFNPYVVYTVDSGILIAMSDKEIGVKYIDDSFYHVIELETNKLFIPTLSYIGYKMNIIFTEGEIEVYGKED